RSEATSAHSTLTPHAGSVPLPVVVALTNRTRRPRMPSRPLFAMTLQPAMSTRRNAPTPMLVSSSIPRDRRPVIFLQDRPARRAYRAAWDEPGSGGGTLATPAQAGERRQEMQAIDLSATYVHLDDGPTCTRDASS